MQRIDAHTHLMGDHPRVVALLEELDLKVLNIGVVDNAHGSWREHLKTYRALADEHPDRFAWVTTFEPLDFGDPHYAERVIEALDRDFAAGAVGCKIWKHVGMELKKADGSFLLPDDAVFNPIYAHLEKVGQPLLMHIAEPLACWQPLRDGAPHCDYYRRNPQWHMYTRPEAPSHAALMAARDRVAEQHPRLRVIGAHLGSLEYSLQAMADHFERYANFAVDTAGRLWDLMYHYDADSLRAFFTRYQDRLLWGTDLVRFKPYSQYSDEQREDDFGHVRRLYATEHDFYVVKGATRRFERDVEHLALPGDVLRKLFVDNARAWYPGL